MRNKRISDDNVITSTIICSDDDLEIVQNVYVGINERGELIVSAEETNYLDDRYDCCTWIEVRRDETMRLARRLRVSLVDLPRHISECMDYWHDMVHPSRADVADCINEIIESLLDEHCNYSIHRIYGRDYRMCC